MADDTLAYRGPGVRVSRWALVAFWLSILGALLFMTVLAPLIAMVTAMVVRGRIAARTDVGGQRFASAAVVVSASSVILGLLSMMAMPLCGCGGHEMSARGTCAANLRGIVQTMNLYAASESDRLPMVGYAAYDWSMNDASRTATAPVSGQAGSTQACVWLMVSGGSVSPKQFICKSDPWASAVAPTSSPGGRPYNNFSGPHQLSYSLAYPWRGDGTLGAWWKATADASLPIAADMTPLQGTGTPTRDLTPAHAPMNDRTWNSSNHQGDGQTVVFADSHAEFVRRPDVGQDNDNIYSMSGVPSTGPSQFGGIPAGPTAPKLMAEKEPFDIVMVPVRNETTGGF